MRYQFDEFTLDTERFELTRAGAALRAEPQVIELLALLVEQRERMVTKEEINDKVWRGRVVSDAALSSRIKMLRQLLDDDGQAQRYIRTIHKRGFRFVGELRPIDTAATPAPPAGEPAAGGVLPSNVSSGAADATTARSAVAVLPLTNLSHDAAQGYFSDGVTTDIIARLSKHRWLDVVARNTSFGYKDKCVDVRDLRAALAVDYVVEGTVQRAGDRVRVSVQLVDTRSGHSKWSARYDRRMSDLFDLQDEITELIVAQLEPEIGFAERNRVVHARPATLQAWDCYHMGTFHFFKFTAADNREAQRLLLQCQQLDPCLGDAYAWWAYAAILGMVYWDTPATQVNLDKALGASDKALSLDPQNATFLALRARVRLARREYTMAITDNEQALRLNPTFAAAYCGLADSLAYEMRYDEAVEYFLRAIHMSPNDPQLWAFLSYGALAMIFKGDFTTALEWADRASSIPNCLYWTASHKAVALALLGRDDEARHTVAMLLHEMPEFTCAFVREKLFYLKEQQQIDIYLGGLRRAGVPAG
jgi:TolB-like protein/Tfp pilus assembly protein PilF